jgi:hypothetical protein
MYTYVTLILTDTNKFIYTQPVKENLQNKYTFYLNTSGKNHTIFISDGYTFHLKSSYNKPCKWILECVENCTIQFYSSFRIQIGKSLVNILSSRDSIYVRNKNGKVLFKSMISYIPVNDNNSLNQKENSAKETLAKAIEVGEYFWNLFEIYDVKHGYEVIGEIMNIMDHAIINKIDFINHEISFESQYIYRTEHEKMEVERQISFTNMKTFQK